VSDRILGPAAERVLFIDMGRVEITGDLAEQGDIVTREGALILRRLPRFDLVVRVIFDKFCGHRTLPLKDRYGTGTYTSRQVTVQMPTVFAIPGPGFRQFLPE